MYDDDDVLLNGAKALVAEGVHISDVYSPMPIHGIDLLLVLSQLDLVLLHFYMGLQVLC
jgi:hypothetical protein